VSRPGTTKEGGDGSTTRRGRVKDPQWAVEATPSEKQNRGQKTPNKDKNAGKEMKQNETGEGRNSKPRWRLVGKTKNQSKGRPILHQIQLEGAKLLQKGRPGEKQKQTRGKTRGRREAAGAWTSGK
jgi:hypothetical protein